MHVIFEEAGKLTWGRVLSEAESSAQVELPSGKRVKVKLAQILLKAGANAAPDFLAVAQAGAPEVDLDLAWEAAPDEVFGFEVLALEYHGAKATLAQQASVLCALHDAPHYFRRQGKGQFKKADAQTLALALAAIERKKQVQAQIEGWARDLTDGTCPLSIREQLFKILFKPDKNAPEYKAVAIASRDSQLGALDLLQRAHAIESPYAFHWHRFLFEHFPKGVAFPSLPTAGLNGQDLPMENAEAFSIDDSQTTEIDDALSVSGLGSGRVTLGIHIAAPSLGIRVGDAVDEVARSRLSTVYMPGHKITMLPADWVAQFSLDEGKACAAVSLWLEVEEETCQVLSTRSSVGRVVIAHNLRHDLLADVVTPDWLASHDPSAVYGLQPKLAWLWKFAQACKIQRELVRGKPESFNRPDYNFRLLDAGSSSPTGDEVVELSVRARGEPLDLIVAECMIVANHHWGKLLADSGVPGIYRSQHSLAPGIKVRMGTKPAPHAGIGVPCYAWSTSPLRRYTDLVNQWQIVSCIRHGATAALAAPFKPKDAALLGIVGAFDSAYASYNTFQSGMERYWVLKHLQQAERTQLQAAVIKDGPEIILRASDLPLVFGITTQVKLTRGQSVRVSVRSIDLVSLELHVQLLEVLVDASPSTEASDGGESEEEESASLGLQVVLEAEQGEPAAAGASA